MSVEPEETATLSPVKRAYLALERAQRRIHELEQARSEPIAIVGLACRFPGGAHDPDTFWRLLAEGVDAVGDIPPGRWDVGACYDPDPAVPGKMSTRRGGFLQEPVDRFDPQLFGISPREAEGMDPQQRLLLELAWEALEDGAQMDERLAGSPTGVFVGITAHDYADLLQAGNVGRVGMHTITGTTHNAAAGRLSYVLGLRGPCMAIDTACSSSLVALHVACGALHDDECRRALVGGVNLMLSPMATIALSQGGVLARDGVCRAFDRDASGMVRGEGGAVLVLKRLSAALEDGDTIHALVRATAVNQDGPSSGLTVPNGPAQEALIRRALAKAKLSPEAIDYIEAHGTGTPLGDPIELQALARVFAGGRERPLLLGSVKTNIGHLEACSGLAGVIKTVLSLKARHIPPHLHFREATPHVPWSELPFQVPVQGQPWEASGKPRLAGVSSFGFSGVNAHVILEEAPADVAPPAGDARPLHLLALSARSDQALRQLARRYQRRLEAQPHLEWADVCHSANAGRVHAGQRLAVPAATVGEAAVKLSAFLDGAAAEGVVSGTAEGAPKVAFLFTGQGSQAVHMGRELYRTHPLFRQILERCDAVLQPCLRRSLLDVLYPDQGSASPLDDTAYAQPALFALEYALAQLWLSWGVRPHLVLGHSLGEYVAACVAGVFTLEDGLQLVAQRAALMQSLPRDGAMWAVFAPEVEVEAAIRPYADRIAIAACNGPANTVISGRREALADVLSKLEADGIGTQALKVSHAFHSPLIDPILDRFQELVGRVSLSLPATGLVSNLSGQLAGAEITTPGYWREHMRQPVRFHQGLATMAGRGCSAFIEMGSKPTLLGLARQSLEAGEQVWLPSLRPGQSDWRQLLESLGTLYVQGAAVDWAGFGRGFNRRRIPLPTYPFQRRRYWMEVQARPQAGRSGGHPLLGSRLDLPGTPEIRFTARISLESVPFLRDHRVFGAAVMPAAAYLDMAAAAAAQIFGGGAAVLENVAFEQALTLEEGADKALHLVLTPAGTEAFDFAVHSKDADGSDWVRHVSGRLARSPVWVQSQDLNQARDGMESEVRVEEVYRQCEARGIVLGTSFRALRRLWSEGQVSVAQLGLPEGVDAAGYRLHPVLLDGALQAMGGVFTHLDSREVYLPVALDRMQVFAPVTVAGWSRVKVLTLEGGLSVDVSLFDAAGAEVARLEGLQLARTDAARLHDEFGDWFYEVQWQPLSLPRAGLPDPETMRQSILPELSESVLAQPVAPDYERGIAAAEELSVAYIATALRRLGWAPRPGETVEADALAGDLGIAQRHRRLFGRLLEILAEAGQLRKVDGGWQVVDLDQPKGIDQAADAAPAQFPAAFAELSLLRRCGTRLAEILSGRCDPLELLFAQGEAVTAATLYGETPAARAANGAARDVLHRLVEAWPADRTLRILEIGAGTGATTAELLTILPADRTEYTFTDVGPVFLDQAAAKFAGYPFLRTRVLDLERDPAGQGFQPHGYDLVIAANVLHATADLARSLANAHGLLAPGGLLLLLEGTAPLRFIDLTFGLLDGWWRFADEGLRAGHPLLKAPQWQSVLESQGFQTLGGISSQANGIWSKQALLLARARPLPRCTAQRWLILASLGDIGLRLQAAIEAEGGTALLIRPGQGGDCRHLLVEAGQGLPFTHVAHLAGLDAASPEKLTAQGLDEALACGCAPLVELLKAAQETAMPSELWIVTCQAQKVQAADTLESLAQASLWGLARTVALEYPDLQCRRVDLESLDHAEAALLDLMGLAAGEDQVAWRDGQCLAPWLSRCPAQAREALPIRADGCYLITGGLRGLGLETARWLVERGAKSLVLTGRSGPSPEAESELARWREAGVSVEAVQADAGDGEQMASLLARIGAQGLPLRGVVHSAGQLDDGVLAQQDESRFRRVFRAKVQGAWHLHRLTLDEPLDFFVLYSSMAALLGSAGQGNHAAANAFLDQLAQYRRSQGLPGLSIAWGGWSEVGAAAGRARSERIQAQGMGLISPRQGTAILGRLLSQDRPQVGVAPIDWARFSGLWAAGRRSAFFSGFTRTSESASVESRAEPEVLDLEALRAGTASQRREGLRAFLRGQVACVLRLVAQDVDLCQPLNRLGLDSLMAVELRNRVRGQLGVDLPLVRFMEDKGIADLAAELDDKLSGPERAPAEPVPDAPLDAGALLAQLDELSEEQVDALLGSVLAGESAVTRPVLGGGR